MPNHAIPGHFRLHRIKTNRNLTRFSSVRVGRKSIRPTDSHARGLSKLIPIQFLIPRIKTNRNLDEFLPGRVGAYCIRPTNGHAGGRTDRKIAIFQVARVGRNSIRSTDDHGSDRTDRKIAIFSGTRVGAQQHTPHMYPARASQPRQRPPPSYPTPGKVCTPCILLCTPCTLSCLTPCNTHTFAAEPTNNKQLNNTNT